MNYAFKSHDGAVMIYRESKWNRDRIGMPTGINGLLYSPDGASFYQAVVRGGGSRSCGELEEHSFTFSVPQLGIENRKAEYDGYVLLSEQFFNKVDPPTDVTIIPLPKERVPVYMYRVKDSDTCIYVDNDKYSESYETHQLFIGKVVDTFPRELRRLEVKAFNRFRDGGTTIIKTDEGELYVPTPFRDDLLATWQGKELEKVNKDEDE